MGQVVSIGSGYAKRDERVEAHLNLVPPIARLLARRLPPSFDLDDLIAAGNIGLLHAATHFSVKRGVAFPVYARHCIRGAILQSIRRAQYRDSTHEELVECGFDNQEFAARHIGRSPVEPAVVIEFPDYSLRRRIDEAIAGLSPRLREVIELYYSREQLTFAEVAERVRGRSSGAIVKFHAERASQLHNEAIRVLREVLKEAA